MIKLIIFCFLSLTCNIFAGAYEERFERIYGEKLWGVNELGEGFSGGGSKLENIRPYYEYLTYFLSSKNIRSVVDLGCGDWEFAKHMDWTGIDYKGFDVVKSVIEKNNVRYGKDTIHFYCGNFLEMEIPSADLLICKHVLQHMPTADVLAFVKTIIPKFKHCIIVEDMTNYPGYNIDHPLSKEFPFWEDRGTDLTKPPFNLSGTKTYFCEPNGNKHLILHIENAS
jgi:SAM-dependent methyltransferase